MAMEDYEVIGYTQDGAFYCPDCCEEDENNPEQSPVFAGECDSFIGDACGGGCKQYFTPDLEWDLITNSDHYAWARCDECNSCKPFDNEASTRLRARRGLLGCDNCIRGRMHFHAK